MKTISLKTLLLSGALTASLVLSPVAALAAEAADEVLSAVKSTEAVVDDEATYSVTFYHFEMMFYDDPSFVQPEAPELTNLRLIGTQTVDGLKVGDRLNTWDYVGTQPGFTFFDAWPREIVVSDNPAANAVQLNYFRNTSAVTVNYYHAAVLSEPAVPQDKQSDDAPVVSVSDVPVQFTKLGSEVREGELFADVLTGDELAPAIDGLQYAGSWPEEVSVKLDPAKNEINLVYGTAAHLPDDAYTEDDAANLPDDVYVEDDAVNLPDGVPVEDDVATLPDDIFAGADSVGDANGGEGDKPSADNDASPSDREEAAEDSTSDEPTTQIIDDATPMADGEKRVLLIPQTGDATAATAVALGALAAASGAAVAFARRRASKELRAL
ncbi:LPXTG cell wall anchor domain-containing protein [uncultured Adlercreutzia sp.]|uniref:LPXTG cell wall anchor domain-containing protein n=1 Tax=uncultured Adlercreutzia sp. TaxID=875803 RepID=UPI0025DF4936|nr:LPXTG cell wall anchor domain-containing protein [uncultured Adlercreutzia sp.]